MRMKDIAVGVKDLFMLDPRTIVIEEGWNVRQRTPDLETHIQELVESIRQVGVLEPITVYLKDGRPCLTNGHCRHEAVLRLLGEGVEIKAVPARTEERTANDAERVLSMATRNNGKPLTPLELATVFKRLTGYGWEPKEIASKVGKSVSYVTKLLDLLAAPEAVLEMVRHGEVSASAAAKTVRREGGERAVETLKAAKTEAEAAGKERVTPKLIRKAAEGCGPATPPPINWTVLGPKLMNAILAVREAASDEEREVAIAEAIDLVDQKELAS